MPDITMCSGTDCELKDNCYRYTAQPNEFRQSFFLGTPFTKPDECDHYWPTKETDNVEVE